MRLGNAFRKGYSDAVDTSRRRRSENAELFNNYVKLNADMGAKVSAADLEGFKGSLSGGSSYFGAGLPSTDALQETSKRLGQIQSNKQTIAAGNARAKSLQSTQTAIAIAKELSGQYMHTDFSAQPFTMKDGSTRMMKGGLKEYLSFSNQLEEAGINTELFTRDWFTNNAAMNQQQYALNYFQANGIDQISTLAGWEAASVKADQPWLKTRIKGMQDIFLDKTQKNMALTARTSVIDNIGVNYGDYNTQAKFLEAGLAAFNNSFTGGHTPNDAQLKLMTTELNSIYEGKIDGLIAADLNSIQENLLVDLTTPEGIEAAFQAYYAGRNRDVTSATEAQKTAFVTKQRQMNAPKRLEQAETAFNATIDAMSSGQASVKNRKRFVEMNNTAAAEEVENMLNANGVDYARLAAFDPNLREKHRATLAARIDTVRKNATAAEETADTSALETYILKDGGEVQQLFKAQRLPDRKGQLFAILNNQRVTVLGMEPYKRTAKTQDFDDERPSLIPGVQDGYDYDADFEAIFDRLDAAGNVAYLQERAARDALAQETITGEITAQREWWANTEHMQSVIPGNDESSGKMRSVAYTLGGQYYITSKQRQLIGPAIIDAFKALGIENEGELSPTDGTSAAKIVAENLGLQSSANPATIITNYIKEQNQGIPEAGTYWDVYLDGEFETGRSLFQQMIAARITNQPITTDPTVIQKAVREILADIERDKQDFRIGLDEDELRYSLHNTIPINGDVQYDEKFADVIDMVRNAKPMLKPPYMTRVNMEGEDMYIMQTDNAIRKGTEDGYDSTKVYRLVDGALEAVADLPVDDVIAGEPVVAPRALPNSDSIQGQPFSTLDDGDRAAIEQLQTGGDDRAAFLQKLTPLLPTMFQTLSRKFMAGDWGRPNDAFEARRKFDNEVRPNMIKDMLENAGLPVNEDTIREVEVQIGRLQQRQ
jgi:hypothetical protein